VVWRKCPNCGLSYDDETRARSGPFHFLVGGVLPASERWRVTGHWASGVFTPDESLVQTDEQGRLVRLDYVEMEKIAVGVGGRRRERRLLATHQQASQLAMHRCLWSTSGEP